MHRIAGADDNNQCLFDDVVLSQAENDGFVVRAGRVGTDACSQSGMT